MAELWTCKELADHLKVSPGTIRVWTSKGKIPVTHVGRCARYNQVDIEQWVKKQNRRKAVLA